MCYTNKEEYETRREAERVMFKAWRSSSRSRGRKLPSRVYFHTVCGKWHLTSQARKDNDDPVGHSVTVRVRRSGSRGDRAAKRRAAKGKSREVTDQ